MRRVISVFLISVLLLLMAVSAAMAGEICSEPERCETDDLTWEFDEDTGTLMLHGSGPMRTYLNEVPEWEVYREQITTVCLDDGITSVGECAFYNYGSLQTAVLPDSIEVIDSFAFYYCWALRSITIPAKLRYAGRMCFYNTLIHDPADIVFPEGMEYIGDEAFHSALKTDGRYVIPSAVRYIGTCALTNAMVSDIDVDANNPFYMSQNHALLTKDGTELLMAAPCAEETEYTVPEGVVKIGRECFNVMLNLRKLTIPSSVTEIENAAIFSTFNLQEISVVADNPAYKTIDGGLYTIDGKTLVAYPDGIDVGGQLVIPEGVERIAPYVFYGRLDEDLTVTLPGSLKEIGEMSMPGGVTEVVYGGSEADWQAVIIGNGNNSLENAVIRCDG